jgi:hypothetical protein
LPVFKGIKICPKTLNQISNVEKSYLDAIVESKPESPASTRKTRPHRSPDASNAHEKNPEYQKSLKLNVPEISNQRAWQESNLRPSEPESDALSPELHALVQASAI